MPTASRCRTRTDFYPRPPWGGRPSDTSVHPAFRVFLSTPSVGRATIDKPHTFYLYDISIHALRGEGDGSAATEKQSKVLFLSTPSVGRATGAPPESGEVA